MLRILQVGTGSIRIPPDKYGGTESHIFNTARHMVGYGHEVTILDTKSTPEDRDAEVIDGIHFVRFYTRQPGGLSRNTIAGYVVNCYRTFLFALKTNRYLKENKRFDVVHVHGPLIGLVLAYLNRSLRDRMVFSDYSPGWFEKGLGGTGRLSLWLAVRLMRRTAMVTVQNGSIKKYLVSKHGFNPNCIAVVHTGVDTAQYKPGISIDHMSVIYRLKQNNVLFNGRIMPYKGVEYLVRAADILVNERGLKDTLFLLVGPVAENGTNNLEHTGYVKKVVDFIKERHLENNVVLTGAVPLWDLRRLFAACDVFVLPSLSEASPQVIAQAMASAKPVVGTRITGITDLVENGTSGYLVEPANPLQLADKLEYLISHTTEAKKMGLRGRRFAEEELDWGKVSRGILQIYERLVNNRKIH
jgi:D-inositol-3-phosphate glycosyltransferase